MAYNTEKGLTTFHLFAGAGGGILADLLLGHIPIGACEIEEYPRNVLLARQRDGILPEFPIWDDICTLDGKPWRGLVDVVCGGFPCQDISAAGKGAGIEGNRSGLWGEMARIICEIQPRYAFVENSPMLTSRGLHRVLGDLAEMGYDARWCVLGACDAGAPHKRDRIWILGELADASVHGLAASEEREGADERSDERTTWAQPSGESAGLCASGELENVGNSMHAGLQGRERSGRIDAQRRQEPDGSATESSGLWWASDPAEIPDTDKFNDHGGGYGASEVCGEQSGQAEILGCGQKVHCEDRPTQSGLGGMVDGLADVVDFTGTPFTRRVPRVAHGIDNRVSRLKAIGNGQVSACAAIAFKILSKTKHLSTFDTEKEAALAYNVAALGSGFSKEALNHIEDESPTITKESYKKGDQ